MPSAALLVKRRTAPKLIAITGSASEILPLIADGLLSAWDKMCNKWGI